MILAIDFDDTIVHTEWPKIIGLRPGAKKYVNKLYEDGHQIIIWTCRSGEHEEDAKRFLEREGVKYHRINENCPVRTEFYDNDSRKIGADLYIDDKGIMGIPSWKEIYKLVCLADIKLALKEDNEEVH